MDPHSDLLALVEASGLFTSTSDAIQPALSADLLPLAVVWTTETEFTEQSGSNAGRYRLDVTCDVVLVPAADTTDRLLRRLRDDLIRHVKRSTDGRSWTAKVSRREYIQIGAETAKVERLTMSYLTDDVDYSQPQ